MFSPLNAVASSFDEQYMFPCHLFDTLVLLLPSYKSVNFSKSILAMIVISM